MYSAAHISIIRIDGLKIIDFTDISLPLWKYLVAGGKEKHVLILLNDREDKNFTELIHLLLNLN